MPYLEPQSRIPSPVPQGVLQWQMTLATSSSASEAEVGEDALPGPVGMLPLADPTISAATS